MLFKVLHFWVLTEFWARKILCPLMDSNDSDFMTSDEDEEPAYYSSNDIDEEEVGND